jgi:molecular chaperone GrpE
MLPEHDQVSEQEPVEAADVASTAEAETAHDGDGVHGEPDEAIEDEDGHEVALDLDELVARAGKADEYLALAQRTQADFENFRKRMTREVGAAESRGVARIARELLPGLDALTRALETAEADGQDADGDLVAGIKLVQSELLAALGRVGIEAYSPRGERFDPQAHEAMAQQPIEGAESGTIVEVYQQGFRHGETVLRPARVVVAA